VPTPGSLNTDGLDMPEDELEQILAVDAEQWKAEIPPIREFFAEFGDRLPSELTAQLDALEERLSKA
jgi:phosphoenolpyruvate carboxykinase (GTP)